MRGFHTVTGGGVFHRRVCYVSAGAQELKVLQEKDTVDKEKAVGVAVKAAKKLKKKKGGGKKKKKK